MSEFQLSPKEVEIKNLLVTASVVVIDGAAYRLLFCDNYSFTAELEDTDDGYPIPTTLGYDAVDLDRDLIYQLTLVNPPAKQLDELLPTDLFEDSKDWRESDMRGRVEWLLAMYEDAKEEIRRNEQMINDMIVDSRAGR